MTLRYEGIILTGVKNKITRTPAQQILNILIAAMLLSSVCRVAPAQAQEDPDKFIAGLISQMTPEAKVGQLFLVTFPGNDVGPASDAAELINTYRVGGVLFSTANGNITNTTTTPTQVAGLTASLQNLARAAANVTSAGRRAAPFIPLFIAVEQSGNGQPFTQLNGGMTPLPSAMAIGATWRPENATAVGTLVGKELAALGINWLIGPSLDVLDDPQLGGEIGLRSFGGDPYWVGLMGQSYVRGLRTGSQGRMAAVLSHFPGQGSTTETGDADRSLEQLKKVELAPFLSMLQPAAGEQRALADALMTSHVRYRGFMGNIRERTAPVSVDAKAMQALLAIPEVKAWREAGGVLVSDSLGSPLIRRYYDPQGMSLPGSRAAQDALLANNDVLLLSDYGASGLWLEQLNNIKSTIRFFQDKYSTDLAFQARVDDAVARILRLKYKLYPGFDPTTVVVNPALAADVVGRSQATTLQVAQDALTLLSAAAPSTEKGPSTLTAQDSVVIFTEDRSLRECLACPTQPLVGTEVISQTMARLISTRDPARVTSLSFSNLLAFLNGTTLAGGPDVGAALNTANWVVFAVLEADPTVPQSSALKQLVAQRPGLLSNKRIAVLALDVPYHLEPEIVARATAIYALYGRTGPFIETAVRALFGEFRPRGSSPVSVDAVHYRLITQTEPNPNQLIFLFVGDPPTDGKATPVPPSVKVGDTLKVRTGPILDRNGHIVPDGTQVTFSRTFSQSTELPPVIAPTKNGVATASFVLDRIGPLSVRASSEPAMTSARLQLTVAEQPSPIIIFSPPTPTVLPTSTYTPIPPTPVPTLTPSPTPIPPPPGPVIVPKWVVWSDLITVLAGVMVMGVAGYWIQWTRRRNQAEPDAITQSLQWGLWSIVAGLIGYVLYGAGLPGSALARSTFGAWTALAVALIFGVIPMIVGWRVGLGLRTANRK